MSDFTAIVTNYSASITVTLRVISSSASVAWLSLVLLVVVLSLIRRRSSVVVVSSSKVSAPVVRRAFGVVPVRTVVVRR